eukprot:COSAG02_NODE_68715_length_227_cov_7.007812_1_plen_35_part_01
MYVEGSLQYYELLPSELHMFRAMTFHWKIASQSVS